MNILCCVKQVPDVDMMRMDPETGNLVRAGIPSMLNPADVFAVSAAIKLKEQCGGKITLITMGPPAAKEVLRECLALGCDDAILVSDRAFGNADTLATSYSIMMAAKALGEYDLIVAGKESLDGATGQMPAQLAQRFGAALLSSCVEFESVDEHGGTLLAVRKSDFGLEKVKAKMPCVLTVEKENFPARHATLSGKLHALHAPLTVISADDIKALDREKIGDRGSATKVPRMFPPVMPEPGLLLNSAEDLITRLRAEERL